LTYSLWLGRWNLLDCSSSSEGGTQGNGREREVLYVTTTIVDVS